MNFKCGYLLVANQPAKEKGCKSMRADDERAKSCLTLANCHMALGDILRNRNESYEQYYDEARKEVGNFNNRVRCGQRKAYKECKEKVDKCWMLAKQMAIDGEDELSFVNDCDGQTMPYSHNLCNGKKLGHWPKDIYDVMSQFHPNWCNMACSLFRQYNEYHKERNVTVFPQDWNIGLELGIEDQDTRQMGRDIVSLTTKTGLVTTRGGLFGINKFVNNTKGPFSDLAPPAIFYIYTTVHDISYFVGGFYCYKSQANCGNVSCPRIGPDCGAKHNVTDKVIYPCSQCRFDQEKLIEGCAYCGKPLLCDLYAQCTGCSTTDTCSNCAFGSTCDRGKNVVEEDCRDCSGCIETSCQSCKACYFHREVLPHSPEALCLFFNNCTVKVEARGSDTPKQRGLREDILNCKMNIMTKDQCLKGLIAVPWVIPISRSYAGGFVNPKFITFITQDSVCRLKTWVGHIYDDLPHSIVGTCLNDKHKVESLDNRVGIPRMAELDVRKMVSCGKGDAGFLSYLHGATIQLTKDSANGTAYIHSAQWHCTAREEKNAISRTDMPFGIKGQEKGRQTVMCPQEMVVCSVRTYIVNFGGKKSEKKEKYRIVNMKFGCCDVTPAMYYSGINYVVQTKEQRVLDNDNGDYNTKSEIRTLFSEQVQTVPSFRPEPPGCQKFIARNRRAKSIRREGDYHGGIQDYRNCKPVTRLCTGGHFISRLGIEQFADGYYSSSNIYLLEHLSYLLQLDFICTDYNGKSQSVVSLSQGLYMNKAKMGRRDGTVADTIDCGPRKYAFGITTAVQVATVTKLGAFANMRWLRLQCGDNSNADSESKHSKQFTTHKGAKDDDSRPDSDFRCRIGHALCGFHLRPVSFHYSSGYDYKFICCPIPVRQFALQSCPTGVTFDVKIDYGQQNKCKKSPCGKGVAQGVITELVALPKERPTFQNPGWHEKLRYAIVSTTNFKYGDGFNKHFVRNNRTGYIRLTPVVLEPNGMTGDFITGATSFVSFATALTGNLSTAAGKLGAAGGVLDMLLFVNGLINPDPDGVSAALAKISQQLNAIQNAVQQTRVYTEIQRLNVSLAMEFNVHLDEDRNDPRYYTVTATCGNAQYDMFGHDIFYYIPDKVCLHRLEEKWVTLGEAKSLDNRNGTTQRIFVVQFNLVGTVIQGEQRNDLSHWLKWGDLIDNLRHRDGFGKIGNIASVNYSTLTDLFKRPNSIKFYFADVRVPAGHIANVYQLVGICNKWQLYTKIINFKVSAKAEPEWDKEEFASNRLVVRE